ncbi:putative bifunctional diguanylate cyclase/phosphodiesterase [Salinarimonas sp.]|uniref:putative bifunctional diguanylate cyclase/phosphodiesterase n=1 Tax=Salinarimonas sp. TaxID=2766526 RepID=UPI0039190CCB
MKPESVKRLALAPAAGDESAREEIARMVRAASRLGGLDPEEGAVRRALDEHVIVATTDARGVIVSVNEPFCRISGYAADELVGRSHAVVNSGRHPRGFFAEMWRRIRAGEVWRGEICNRAKDGRTYWVDTTIVPMRDHAGAIVGYVSLRIDITDRKVAEEALAQENARRIAAETLLRDVLDALPDGVAAFDRQDRLILWNEAFLETYPKAAAIVREGLPFEELLRYAVAAGQFPQAGTSAATREAWLQARLHEHSRPGEAHLRALGDARWVQVRERRSRSGIVVGVRTDISALKNAERTIKRQSEQDALTGLGNRKVLLRRLSSAMLARQRRGGVGALFFLDLDNLKAVNDTYGHDVGDQLIVALGRRLAEAVDRSASVARIGGDEFAIVVPRVGGEAQALAFAQDLLAGLEQPERIAGRAIAPRCSLGLALFPDEERTAKEILKHADIALYEAKARGRGSACLFDPAMRARLEERRKLAEDLGLALLARDIDIALQPKVAIADGAHVGFEALVRWTLAGRAVPADVVVAVAEENGLVALLGEQVLERTLRTIRSLRDRGLEPGRVAVNVAAAQLRREGFARSVTRLLASHGVEPAALEIEVTEGVLLDRVGDGIGETLAELRRAGIHVALDDFGTGYASLAHLKRFPFDTLKIDRSFVRDLETNSESAVLVRAIVSLAHNLGKSVVAEGVETLGQLAFLREQGCDVAQGYLFARPIMRADVASYLEGLGGAGRARA